MNKLQQLLLFILITFCGCSNLKLQPPIQAPPPERHLGVNSVKEILKDKPEWLFSAKECPADIMPAFEYEPKYFSEGCVNNPQGCLQKCKSNDGNACYALALLFQEQQEAVEENAQALFLRACVLGIVSGCTNRAAGELRSDIDNAESAKCAAKTFEKTCSSDDAWGCTMYAWMLAQGAGGVEQDFDKALKILPKGCKLGLDDPACQEAKRLEEQIIKVKNSQKVIK